MALPRKGMEEFADWGEAGKRPPIKQHTERKQEGTGGVLRIDDTAHFTKSTSS